MSKLKKKKQIIEKLRFQKAAEKRNQLYTSLMPARALQLD